MRAILITAGILFSSVASSQSLIIDDDKRLCEHFKRRACITLYDPVECTYEGKTYSGSNSCVATNILRAELCRQDKVFDPRKLICRKTWEF